MKINAAPRREIQTTHGPKTVRVWFSICPGVVIHRTQPGDVPAAIAVKRPWAISHSKTGKRLAIMRSLSGARAVCELLQREHAVFAVYNLDHDVVAQAIHRAVGVVHSIKI